MKTTQRGFTFGELSELARKFKKRSDNNSILLTKEIKHSPIFPTTYGLAEAFIICKIVEGKTFEYDTYFKTEEEWKIQNEIWESERAQNQALN